MEFEMLELTGEPERQFQFLLENVVEDGATKEDLAQRLIQERTWSLYKQVINQELGTQ